MTPAEARDFLESALTAGRLASGYVIAGPPRTVGRELVEWLGCRLLCQRQPPACRTCPACAQVLEHTHPDMPWVESQMKSRQIGVDQMRELLHAVMQTSFMGGWKVCVIVGADRLNPSSANAFLKTLEEPPPRTLFALLTESPQFLLPTILSRCQRLNLAGGAAPLPPEWRTALHDTLAAEWCGGLLGATARAERVAGLLKTMKKRSEQLEKEEAAGSSADESEETMDARVSARYREWRTALLRDLLSWYRDVLWCAGGGEPAGLANPARAAELAAAAGRTGVRLALRQVQIVEEMNRQLERNLVEGEVLTYGFLRLAPGRGGGREKERA